MDFDESEWNAAWQQYENETRSSRPGAKRTMKKYLGRQRFQSQQQSCQFCTFFQDKPIRERTFFGPRVIRACCLECSLSAGRGHDSGCTKKLAHNPGLQAVYGIPNPEWQPGDIGFASRRAAQIRHEQEQNESIRRARAQASFQARNPAATHMYSPLDFEKGRQKALTELFNSQQEFLRTGINPNPVLYEAVVRGSERYLRRKT